MFNRVFASGFGYCLSRRDGPAKIKTARLGGFDFGIKAPNGWVRVPMAQRAIKTKFLWAHAHTGTHDQYADEQLEKS